MLCLAVSEILVAQLNQFCPDMSKTAGGGEIDGNPVCGPGICHSEPSDTFFFFLQNTSYSIQTLEG